MCFFKKTIPILIFFFSLFLIVSSVKAEAYYSSYTYFNKEFGSYQSSWTNPYSISYVQDFEVPSSCVNPLILASYDTYGGGTTLDLYYNNKRFINIGSNRFVYNRDYYLDYIIPNASGFNELRIVGNNSFVRFILFCDVDSSVPFFDYSYSPTYIPAVSDSNNLYYCSYSGWRNNTSDYDSYFYRFNYVDNVLLRFGSVHAYHNDYNDWIHDAYVFKGSSEEIEFEASSANGFACVTINGLAGGSGGTSGGTYYPAPTYPTIIPYAELEDADNFVLPDSIPYGLFNFPYKVFSSNEIYPVQFEYYYNTTYHPDTYWNSVMSNCSHDFYGMCSDSNNEYLNIAYDETELRLYYYDEDEDIYKYLRSSIFGSREDKSFFTKEFLSSVYSLAKYAGILSIDYDLSDSLDESGTTIHYKAVPCKHNMPFHNKPVCHDSHIGFNITWYPEDSEEAPNDPVKPFGALDIDDEVIQDFEDYMESVTDIMGWEDAEGNKFSFIFVTIDVLKRIIGSFVGGFLIGVEDMFPVNLPIQFYQAYKQSEDYELPVDIKIFKNIENNTMSLTLPVGDSDIKINVFGDAVFKSESVVEEQFSDFRSFSTYLLWSVFIFAILAFARRIFNDIENI